MRVFDKTKTKELTKYDLEKGYLINDILIKTLPEQREEKEVFHYETLAEYPNGGKSVIKVVDKEYIPYLPEREVEEEIQVYIEYTAEELQNMQNMAEIKKLEEWFTQYDKVCNEHSRCQRMGIVCHHDINIWDIQAVENANRLKKLREQ